MSFPDFRDVVSLHILRGPPFEIFDGENVKRLLNLARNFRRKAALCFDFVGVKKFSLGV